MTRIADVSSRGPVFHLLRETVRPGLPLPPGRLPPGAPFPYEAVDDSPGARHDIDSSRCGRPAGPRREGHERRQAARHRGVVTGRFRTPSARTRDVVCGSVRIPLPPSAKRARRPSYNPLSADPSSRLMCGRYRTRVPRTRMAACGGVRIRRSYARANRSSRNPLPAAPSYRPVPDRFCIRLSRTRDAVCGFVRIQDGPHPSRKDTRP